MPSTVVSRRDVLAAIVFTGLVASLGTVSAYYQSKYWPGTNGIASWSAASAVAFFSVVVGNLLALVIAGVTLVYKRARQCESPPIFGIYVTVVNVVIAFLLWILPQIF